MLPTHSSYDLLVIGGGINGVGVARDAAGRGLRVILVEQADLAAATSSASSKLIHGGLRYLERYEFRLVAEALAEREVLLKIAPHLVTPLAFVMPHVAALRPRWMIRTGLFLYDHLGRRTHLPASRAVDLRAPPYAAGLKPDYVKGFVYSDCQVDDSRLVVANARSAHALGADIMTYTQCVEGNRKNGGWDVLLRSQRDADSRVFVRAVVNAAGPWVKEVLTDRLRQASRDNVKLVKGSHIVVPRAYEGEHAFILQNDDRRVVFMIPYEGEYTLIGTTDVALENAANPSAGADESVYLCRAANRYLKQPVDPTQVVWSFAGIRPLYDDGSTDPSAVTRDYVLRLDTDADSAPVVSVYGGKITTYRKLAERVIEALAPWFPALKKPWTFDAPLPGGELGGMALAHFIDVRLRGDFPWLPESLLHAVGHRHGVGTYEVLEGTRNLHDLGRDFGSDLYAREVDHMLEHEWARNGDDILYRRSKTGLHVDNTQRAAVTAYVASRVE